MTPDLEIFVKIVELLQKLEREDQIRVLNSVAQLLGIDITYNS